MIYYTYVQFTPGIVYARIYRVSMAGHSGILLLRGCMGTNCFRGWPTSVRNIRIIRGFWNFFFVTVYKKVFNIKRRYRSIRIFYYNIFWKKKHDFYITLRVPRLLYYFRKYVLIYTYIISVHVYARLVWFSFLT